MPNQQVTSFSASELEIPVPYASEDDLEGLTVLLSKGKEAYEYRLETFPWNLDSQTLLAMFQGNSPLEKLIRLKKALDDFEEGWQLVKILTPGDQSNEIKVIYRKHITD